MPPLNAVRAFEAAGRRGSFVEAAGELHVTPAAVSHQIKSLEQFLQARLFLRSARGITLTPLGAQYLADISKHLAGVQKATDRITAPGRRKTLRLQTHATIALKWLIPRLSSFHASNSDIDLKLTTSLQSIDFSANEYDCGIQLGSGSWKGLNASPLLRNELSPACTPSYAAHHFARGGLNALKSAVLLHSLGRQEDWSYWLDSAGAKGVDPTGGLTYDSSVFAYQAALEGHGVAIAQLALIQDDVQAGRLVLPFSHRADMGSYTYYFVFPRGRTAPKELDVFRKWVTSQATWQATRPRASSRTA